MIWRGIFQQFTFRGDNGELFGELVRYPVNMFLFTIYFFVWIMTAILSVWHVVRSRSRSRSRACALP